MKGNIVPEQHPDPWVNLIHSYVTQVSSFLSHEDITVHRAWLDPSDPRDATVVFSAARAADLRALVWDEEAGWRQGKFESGHQGVRTTLSSATYLGGGVIPPAREVTGRLIGEVSGPRRLYRSYADQRDGLDEALMRAPEWT